jgi:hypothetical protein
VTGKKRIGLALIFAAAIAVAVDWLLESVRGLGPAALLIIVGWLFILRTEQDLTPSFAGPERHLPWLQASGWFFIGTGLFGVLLSLLSAL